MWKHKNFINLQLCAGPQPFPISVNGTMVLIARLSDSMVPGEETWSYNASINTDKYTISGNTVVWNDGTILQYNGVDVLPTDDIVFNGQYTTRSATPTLTFKHFYDAGTIGSGTVKFRHYSQRAQLATPQNVSVSGTIVSWGAVENATSYEILADGVSIGTVENETGIPFTIAGTTYRAEEGMTWEQWCDSKYNTGGYTYHSTDTVIYVFKLSDKQFTIANADNSMVHPTDKINANVEYIHMAYPKVTIINSGGISLKVYNYYKEEADAGYNENYINAGSQITISGEPVARPGPPLQYVHIWAYGGIIPTLFEQDIDVTGSIDLMQIIDSVHAIFYVGGNGTITARPHDDD